MTRSSRSWLPVALAAFALAALAAPAPAAGPSLAGNWKFKEVSGGRETTLALVKIEVKDGKPTASVLSAPLIRGGLEVEGLKVSDSAVKFDLKIGAGGSVLAVALAVPKGEDKPATLRGTYSLGKRPVFAELERTDAEKLSQADAQKQTEGGLALVKVYRTPLDEREAPLKEVVEKYGDTSAGYSAAEALLALRAKAGAGDADLRAPIDVILKVAKLYGAPAEKYAVLSVAQTLTRAPKAMPLAVEFARKAEKGLTKDDSPRSSENVLKTLAWALKKNGKADEAKEVEVTLAKLGKELDEEFERTSIPFKVSPATAKKKGRVAVVELFTGAQCPPCVSADIAFDAAVKAYGPADVVFLEYHEHIPGPDPLTNEDTEGRMKYYGQLVRGTPTAFVNGKTTPPLGGGKDRGEESYGLLSKAIDKALDDDSDASFKLVVTRKGDKVEAEANVSGLKATGEKVRLRFLLVEDVVHYPGSNDQRFHHHVVRAFPGGLGGFEVKEGKATQKVLVDLAELKKGLTDYLAESDKKRTFIDEDRPLELKRLRVVALVQNDEGHEILQAAQVDVPGEK
jgi:hypothetical protein